MALASFDAAQESIDEAYRPYVCPPAAAPFLPPPAPPPPAPPPPPPGFGMVAPSVATAPLIAPGWFATPPHAPWLEPPPPLASSAPPPPLMANVMLSGGAPYFDPRAHAPPPGSAPPPGQQVLYPGMPLPAQPVGYLAPAPTPRSHPLVYVHAHQLHPGGAPVFEPSGHWSVGLPPGGVGYHHLAAAPPPPPPPMAPMPPAPPQPRAHVQVFDIHTGAVISPIALPRELARRDGCLLYTSPSPRD